MYSHLFHLLTVSKGFLNGSAEAEVTEAEREVSPQGAISSFYSLVIGISTPSYNCNLHVCTMIYFNYCGNKAVPKRTKDSKEKFPEVV